MHKNTDLQKLAEDVSRQLIEVKAVAVDTQNFFQFVSGILSPIYVDNRKIISFPDARNLIIDGFLEVLKQEGRVGNFDVIAGVATGGIPWAAWIAARLNMSMVYVRPLPKDRGMKRQVEGILHQEQKVVIIEDLITTGMSSVNAAEAIRAEGGLVDCCASIFSFQAPSALRRFEKYSLKTYSLTNLSTLISTAKVDGHIDDTQVSTIEKWSSTTLASANLDN